MKKIYRHKSVLENGTVFKVFSSKSEIEDWINEQIQERGLDWRAGYKIRFRDGLRLEFLKKNGKRIKI